MAVVDDIVERVSGGIDGSGKYRCSFELVKDFGKSGKYRARLFFLYCAVNDLSGDSGLGLYAVPSNPCDTVSYESWDGKFRKPYHDISPIPHDSSFNTEVVCEFSDDTLEHSFEFCNHAGSPAKVTGESVLDREYTGDSLPVNILFEKLVSEVSVESAAFDPVSGRVTVVTRGDHGFSDGDAVTVTGYQVTDHSYGVYGERFNGTYRITRLSPDSFYYVTEARPDFSGSEELDVSRMNVSKWSVCTYIARRSVMSGASEAIVLWESHTFVPGDRVTLMTGNSVVAENAVVCSVAPNSFVCRSGNLDITDEVDTVLYAPRTPVSNVPANYIPMASGAKAGSVSLDNSSTLMNMSPDPIYPYAYGAFELAPDYQFGDYRFGKSGTVRDGKITVSNRKFAVISFMPPVTEGGIEGNCFRISVVAKASTEVSAVMYLSALSGTSWTEGSTAAEVYRMAERSPLSSVVIQSDPGAEQSCNYDIEPRVFTFELPVSVSENFCRAGVPVSMMFILRGREGSEVTLSMPGPGVDPSAFRIELQHMVDGGEHVPLPVTVVPVRASAGDRVTVYTNNAGTFDAMTGNYRVRVGESADPDEWSQVISNTGESLSFVMPSGYSGDVSLTVMEKPPHAEWSSGEAFECSEPVDIYAVAEVTRVVKLNERMKPGVIDKKVSRSAAYNRDFAFNGFCEITDENSMIQNLYSCLLTRRGERMFNPDFGTTIEDRIYSIRTGGSSETILKECISVLETYEPRITLVYEHCKITDMGPHGIYLTLGVILPSGNVETISIPFKNRGRA